MLHIVHEFGCDSVREFVVQIAGVVNTCAALNTVYLPFGMPVCKEYSWLVKALYGPKCHHPIVLTGIVKEDKSAMLTKLRVAFILITLMLSRMHFIARILPEFLKLPFTLVSLT